jgi:hypothetical protein
MVNSYTLLGALQAFLEQRGIAVDALTADPAVALMLDWFRQGPVDAQSAFGDALVFRYGGWSEGCATGFRLSLLRRIAEQRADGGETEWFVGITLLYEPSSRAEIVPFSTTSLDSDSLDAFVGAVRRSPGFKAVATDKPMGAMLESGGIR